MWVCEDVGWARLVGDNTKEKGLSSCGGEDEWAWLPTIHNTCSSRAGRGLCRRGTILFMRFWTRFSYLKKILQKLTTIRKKEIKKYIKFFLNFLQISLEPVAWKDWLDSSSPESPFVIPNSFVFYSRGDGDRWPRSLVSSLRSLAFSDSAKGQRFGRD